MDNIDKIPYENLIQGDIPPWVMRFLKTTGKGINQFDMIRDKENILLGISGGKDSLALALSLSLRKKWLPIDYNIHALMINWKEYPVPPDSIPLLEKFFKDLNIDFTIVEVSMFPTSFKDDFNCYLCSRNKRRILFEKAEELNCPFEALGHHLDDLVETTMMNLFFRGKFSTMQPVQPFFDGKIHIIRPMILVHEGVTKRLAETYSLPAVKAVCPYDSTNIRSKLKPIVKELCHIDHLTREHILNSHEFNYRIPR